MILRTRQRLEALAREIQAVRAEQADFKANMVKHVDDVVAKVDGIVVAMAVLASESASAANVVADNLATLREALDQEQQLVGELREEISGLNGKVGEQAQALERSRNTLGKLERQLKEHGDELRTVTTAMLARLKVVEQERGGRRNAT